jgi:membrane protein involved in colicin uptake
MWNALVIATLLVACSKQDEPKLEKLPAEFKAEAEKIATGLADQARATTDKASATTEAADKVVKAATDKAGAATELAKAADLAEARRMADSLANAPDDDDSGDVGTGKGLEPAGFTCTKGNCTQTCAAGKTCKFRCPGGNCTQTCEKGSTCEVTCSGGNCTQRCDGPCKKSCSGGTCT